MSNYISDNIIRLAETYIHCFSRGLWAAQNGTIEFPFTTALKNDNTTSKNNQNAIYYLPQKPFLSDNGSLRQLISYPSSTNNSIAETQWIVDKLKRLYAIFTNLSILFKLIFIKVKYSLHYYQLLI